LVVRVTDPTDRPVADVEVVFVPPAGAEVAPAATVRTGPKGEAAVRYTLSTAAGEQLIQARAAAILPSSSSSATFKAMAQPDAPEELVTVRGDGQSGPVSAVLAESLVVRAVDHFGNGVAGVEVTWQAGGGGSVNPTSATTGADGRAATQLTLGDRPGSYRPAARVEGLKGSPLSFTVTAVGPQLSLVTPPSATAAAGIPFERQPELQLQDPLGASLHRADVNVTVQIAGSDGSLGGRTTATSDANGLVRFSDLAIRGPVGTRTLIFAADGFTSVTSSPITVTAGPPATGGSSASVPNGTAGAPTTIEIHVADQFGNPVAGAAAGVSISVAGVNPTPALPIIEVGGGVYSASYVPVHSGTDGITIQVAGGTLAGSPFSSAVVPGPADPTTTTAIVPGRTRVFEIGRIDVVTRDAQGNQLNQGGAAVAITFVQGANRTPLPPESIVDNGDGTYSGFYSRIGIGAFSVEITLNGAAIQGSPYSTFISLF
jgi:hypothetical protein